MTLTEFNSGNQSGSDRSGPDLSLPKAVLLDLDDTILDDTGNVEYCWHLACFTHCSDLPDVDPATMLRAIENTRDWFWSDPERHRIGRLDLAAARLQIVKTSLVDLGIDNPALAIKISDTYHSQREAGVRVFPDAWIQSDGFDNKDVDWLW